MKVNKEIQNIIDKLTYNKLCAPDYPVEHKRTLDGEESRVLLWLDRAIAATRREDVGDWLRLGRSSVEQAFAKLQTGDRRGGVRDFEFAVQYLENALARKPHKITFVSGPEGTVSAPPSSEE